MTMILSSRPESLSPFWARCDEAAHLWNSHEHLGASQSKSRRKSQSKQTTKKRRQKNGNSSSKSSDDEYYLRWNPTGNFDSDDDDWWSEIMALERPERKSRCCKKTRREGNSVYLQYKYHTKRVIDWGNSFWAEDNRMTSDISLRTIIWRLNNLAFHGITMPKMIYRNLELAVILREEFQIRFVSEKKDGEENVEARKKSRDYTKSTDPSALLSPWPRNIGNSDTSYNIGADTVEERTLIIDKYDRHRWILDQLKALLELFGDSSGSEKFDPVNGNNSQVSSTTEKSRESVQINNECSHKTQTHSRTNKERSFEIDPFQTCTRRSAFVPTKVNKNSEAVIKRKKRVPNEVKSSIDFDHKNVQREISESESGVGVVLEESLLSKNMFCPLTDENSSDRSDHMNKCDSVWDLSFLAFEEATELDIDIVTSTQKGDVSLQNSEPPEDWELLLEEDEDETISEILELQVTTPREENPVSRVALSTKKFGVEKIESHKGDVGGSENKHPNQQNGQKISQKLKPFRMSCQEKGMTKKCK